MGCGGSWGWWGECLPTIECEPRDREQSQAAWVSILLLWLPATMTWSKLLKLSVLIPKMEIKNSIYGSDTGFLVFIHTP